MAISTRNKSFGGALVVAVAALVFDQLRGSGPARAGAVAIPPIVPLAHTAADEPPVPAAAPSTTDLAHRLRALFPATDPLADLRDVFSPPADWSNGRATSAYPTAESFAAAHRLSVVLLPGDAPPAAVIGGRLVRLGQTVDGYQLTFVGPRSARVTGVGGDVDLRMR